MSVTHFEVTRRTPFAFDYERVDGKLHFAVDPGHAANARIVDIDKAAREADGRVRFWADFVLLQPAQRERSNGRLVLDRIDFRLSEGEIVAVLGKSGSGKSTFLRILAGLVEPSSGHVHYRGQEVHGPAHGDENPVVGSTGVVPLARESFEIVPVVGQQS